MTEFSDVIKKTPLDGTELLLGASSATETSAQKYSGGELYSRGKLDKEGAVNFLDYIDGAPDEDTDYSVQLQQALDDAALNQQGWVYVPPGVYGIGATVNLTASMSGPLTGRAEGSFARFKPLITNGTAVLKAVLMREMYWGNFAVALSEGQDSVRPDCVGIDLGYGRDDGTVENTAVTRSTLENVYIQGVTTGLKISGWLNNITDVLIWDADVGVLGWWNSDTIWSIRVEKCKKGFDLHTGNANFFATLTDEGASGTTASTIEGMSGTVIGVYRTEQAERPAVPWLIVTSCTGFSILGGYVYTPGVGAAAIELVNVVGYVINCRFRVASGQSRHGLYRNGTKGDLGTPLLNSNTFQYTDKAYFQQFPRVNRLPNPYMQGLRFPFDIEETNVALSEETDRERVWQGAKALKVTIDPGTGTAYAKMRITSPAVLDFISNRRIGLCAWIYIPDLPSFAPGGAARPAIGLSTYKDTTESNLTMSVDDFHVHNGWCMFNVYKLFSVIAPDEMWIYIYVTTSATTLSGGEYVVVGNMVLTEGPAEYETIMGKWADSPLSGSQSIGSDNIEFTVTVAEAATVKTYTKNMWAQGDRLTYTDPATHMGEVCTTAGTGAAAVWQTYGALGA